MWYSINVLALLLALTATTSWAKDYVINVNGIVCEFCSLGVTKKISKLPFIDQTKYSKGVKVEIEHQLVTIAVKADAQMDQDALFAAIKAGGYHPVDVYEITPDGKQIAYQP